MREGSSVDPAKVREIVEITDKDPLIGEEILKLSTWASKYYACSLGELLKGALPAGISARFSEFFEITSKGVEELTDHEGKQTKRETILNWLNENGSTSLDDLVELFGRTTGPTLRSLAEVGIVTSRFVQHHTGARKMSRKAVRRTTTTVESKLSSQQMQILEVLSAETEGEIFLTDLCLKAECGVSPVRTLAKRGILEIFDKEKRRDPMRKSVIYEDERHDLDEQQRAAETVLCDAIEAKRFETFLLRGVTGSGKTEVYFRVLEKALEARRTALMLVPEIALTPVFSKKLRARFGDDVAILHSNLGEGERHDEWHRINDGEARVVIGTRSAVFSPLKNLGVIVVDEEHDASYRQQESPFYNARDLAIVRAAACDSIVILGSATPSMESFQNARTGKYKYIEIPHRV
jgi:primosomal protein N' (replication factor Y)